MKRIMKLLLGCLLLTVLLGLCVAAQADVETVTVTINVVDGATMEPVPKSLYAYHSQCVTTKYHGEDNCDCFDSLTYYWAFRNLTPCECGERWESDWTQESEGWHKHTSFTFTMKTGHKYLVGMKYDHFGNNEYYTRQMPSAYMWADPKTGEITLQKNGVDLVKTGENTYQLRLLSRLKPVTVDLRATKLYEGKDPGDKKFAFKIWKLTDEEMAQVFDLESAIQPGDPVPEWKPEYDSMEFDEIFRDVFSEELQKIIIGRIRERLEQFEPETTVYNKGKNITLHNKTYTAEDFPKSTGKSEVISYNYVIAEVEQTGNGVCEDSAIYAVSGTVYGSYLTLPSGVDADKAQTMEKVQGGVYWYILDEQQPITSTITGAIGISMTDGLFSYDETDLREMGADLSDIFIFRNTACPYTDANNGIPVTPDVPATGDGSSLMLWAGLMLAAGAALLLLRRRA